MTKLPDMQRAVNDVDGVAAATMRWPEPEGPAFIRIEFEAEADQGVVTERVLEVLREAGGTEMAGLGRSQGAAVAAGGDAAPVNGAHTGRGPGTGTGSDSPGRHEHAAAADRATAAERPPVAGEAPPADSVAPAVGSQPVGGCAPPTPEEPGSAPNASPNGWLGAAVEPGPTRGGGVSETHGHTRPILERIRIERTRVDTTLEVTLDLGDRRADGRATASIGERRHDRVAAEATLGAVGQLLPDTVSLDLQDVATTEQEGPAPTAHVWLTLLGPGRQEDTVGSAIVRHELADAVARATLDAVNRWLPALLDAGPPASAGADVSARRHTAAASE